MRCLMDGLEVKYPCSPICALFGDCVTAFEAQRKASVRTHGDGIRAMTDEQLAKSDYFPCPYNLNGYGECKFGWHTQEQSCEECKLEWLQLHVED